MKVLIALVCAVALCFVLPCASVHEEFLTVTDIIVDNGGAVTEVTNQTDCECRSQCKLKLQCTAVSRFADAPCLQNNHRADTTKVIHRNLTVTKGSDAIFYHAASITPTDKISWSICFEKCSAILGFRMVQIKSKATLQYMQQVQAELNQELWIGLGYDSTHVVPRPASFTGRDKDWHFTWDDGTPLDGNMLGLPEDEPIITNKAPIFRVDTQGRLNDIPVTGYKYYCMCQSDPDIIPQI